MKLPKKIGSRKHAPEFDPHLESVFQSLHHYNDVDDYEAVRPLYGQAHRLFLYGLHQAKATDLSFKLKLRLFMKLLEIGEGEEGLIMREGNREMFLIDNNIPRWIRVAVEPWIGESIKVIDQHMTSLGRPEYWQLLRGSFGKVARKKILMKYANER
ncbi:MAG: hypothetical protein V3U87_16925 [Methylococcaceae bacterium]